MATSVPKMAAVPPSPKPERPKTKYRHGIRIRAATACVECRERKVRCDVTLAAGSPCTNCRLDDKACVTTDRATRRLSRTNEHPRRLSLREDRENTSDATCIHPEAETNKSDSGSQQQQQQQQPNHDANSPQDHNHGVSGLLENTEQISNPQRSTDESQTMTGDASSHMLSDASCNQPDGIFQGNALDSHAALFNFGMDPSINTGYGQLTSEPETLWTSYSFLIVDNLEALSPQDAAFLGSKGCFSIPVKPVLDEFVRHYFLHVHPFLPLLDEADFWYLYGDYALPGMPEKKISVLVFQAMLFASCSFVPQSVIKFLGFDSPRSARAAFYDKTKLLYDFSTEKSSVVTSQAALLLTFWSGAPEANLIKTNTMWLTVAIHHAKSAGAPRAWDPTTACTKDESASYIPWERSLLKRLWWCCLIRDRFLSVGLNRSLQITKSYPVLCMSDFKNEIGHSEVHNSQTKHQLVRILLRLMELCNVLTDLMLLVAPSDEHVNRPQSRSLSKMTDCRLALREWYAKSQEEMASMNLRIRLRQHSVIVHTNLMYMFYHASTSLLSHNEVLIGYCASGRQSDLTRAGTQSQEVQEAAYCTVECLGELIQLDLARYLPLSAVAFTASPLLLYVLDVKFLSAKSPGPMAGQRRHSLTILLEAMKGYHSRFDAGDYVSQAIRLVSDVAQETSNLITTRRPLATWADLLTQQPDLYLRLVLILNLCLSMTKIPVEQDFPASLRGALSPKSICEGPKKGSESQKIALDSGVVQTLGSSQVQALETHVDRPGSRDLDENMSYSDPPISEIPPELTADLPIPTETDMTQAFDELMVNTEFIDPSGFAAPGDISNSQLFMGGGLAPTFDSGDYQCNFNNFITEEDHGAVLASV